MVEKPKDPVTREYTINLHKRLHGINFKKRAPRAVKEVKKFAAKMMRTKDVRVDVKLNKELWSKGIRNVPNRLRIKISRKCDAALTCCTAVLWGFVVRVAAWLLFRDGLPSLGVGHGSLVRCPARTGAAYDAAVKMLKPATQARAEGSGRCWFPAGRTHSIALSAQPRSRCTRAISHLYSRSQAVRAARVLMFSTAHALACNDNAAGSVPRLRLSSWRCCSAVYAGHSSGSAHQRAPPCSK